MVASWSEASKEFDKSGKQINGKKHERTVVQEISDDLGPFKKPSNGWEETTLVTGDYELVLDVLHDGTAPSLELIDKKNSVYLGSIGGGPIETGVVEVQRKDSTLIWGCLARYVRDGGKSAVLDQRAAKVGMSVSGEIKTAPVKDGLYVSILPKNSLLENLWFLDANDNLIGICNVGIGEFFRFVKFK